MTFKAMTQDERFIHELKDAGNLKLKNSKNVRFLVWSIPAQITCPCATKSCKRFCYAKKAESCYPSVLPYRFRALETSRMLEFIENMTYTIECHLTRPCFKAAKKVVVRIHESGDFYNMLYVRKWLTVAEKFIDTAKVVFAAYTKSFKFFDGIVLPKNFRLLASVWDDTAADQLQIIERNDWNVFTAVTPAELETIKASGVSHFVCTCADCGSCFACFSAKYKLIVCLIH